MSRAYTTFADLESPLDPVPLFHVEQTGKATGDPRLWPEIERQAAFVAFIRKTQPQLHAFSNANDGKRGPKAQRDAKRLGLTPGVFDVTVLWNIAQSTNPANLVSMAFVEFKGFDKNGRPGKLSAAQIEWGNSAQAKGHNVACFYSAKSALKWLASLGAPIRGKLQ